MIAEFKLDGSRVVFNVQYNPDAIYGRCKNPKCYQCRKGNRQEQGPFIDPGHNQPGQRGTFMPGWIKIDGRIIPGGLEDEKDKKIREKVITHFLSNVRPRIVHLYGGCLEAWMRDKKAHPGIVMRHEGYITLQRLKERLEKFKCMLRKDPLFRVYLQAKAMAENEEATDPHFRELRSLIRTLERSRKKSK
jgi:hypothetical protein